MESFEEIVKVLLEEDNYWVRQSEKVNLSKEEKKKTGKPSIPRPEIDLVALEQSKNHILVLEVKSYFDSQGVKISELDTEHATTKGRYKLFTNKNYRDIVLTRLKENL